MPNVITFIQFPLFFSSLFQMHVILVAGPPTLSPAYTLNFLEKPTNIDSETEFLFYYLTSLQSNMITIYIFTIAAPFRRKKRDQLGKTRIGPIYCLDDDQCCFYYDKCLFARKSVSHTSLHKALCIGRLTYQPHPLSSSTDKGQIKNT